MKRSLIVIIILTSCLLVSGVTLAGIKYSKHDLSYGSGNLPYKAADQLSGGTREICVFCHTPHSAKADAPLWNRGAVNGTFTTYSSDVLTQLSYPAAEDPATGAIHVKTRICLSCHDGTIGLGSVANMPGDVDSSYSQIQMDSGGGANIAPESVGYIGLDLRDDHPVAIKYQGTAGDPELRNAGSIILSNISLYNIVSGSVQKTNPRQNGDFVECTSCHNPHDNTNGNFLVASNSGSAICTSCHDKKIDLSTSAHDAASGTIYSPGNPSIGGTVGAVKCMNCHFPHKAGANAMSAQLPKIAPANLSGNSKAGYYLLSFEEEMSCFSNDASNLQRNRWGQDVTVCHGNGTSLASGDIQTKIGLTPAHRVGDYTGVHEATEVRGSTTAGWFNGKFHVECADCHNPHTAGAANHTQGTNTIAANSTLYGVSYVRVDSWPNSGSGAWSAPSAINYTPVEPLGVTTTTTWGGTRREYEVCFKCHSSFATNGSLFPNSPSSGQNMTDQSKEFNYNNDNGNGGFHPVVTTNTNTQGTYTGGSGWGDGMTMYCSDCHTTNGPVGTHPQGPHGSTNPFILRTSFDDTYSPKGTNQPVDLCFDCHEEATYLSGADNYNVSGTGFSNGSNNNFHTRHRSLATSSSASNRGYKCVNCHTKIPHGYKHRAMLVFGTDGADVSTYATDGTALITNATLPASQGYTTKNAHCSTVSGCH